jgi:hypothetical protein
VVNPRGTGRRVRRLLVDDVWVTGNVVPLASAGSKVRVRVELA